MKVGSVTWTIVGDVAQMSVPPERDSAGRGGGDLTSDQSRERHGGGSCEGAFQCLAVIQFWEVPYGALLVCMDNVCRGSAA